MKREGRRVALGLAVLLSVSGSFAASSPAKPKAKQAADAAAISAALCGRSKGQLANLANALDELDPTDLPPVWEAVDVEQLQMWLDAKVCPDASEKDADLYESRRRGLEQLDRRRERAKVAEQIGTALAPLRGWSASPDEWPSNSECAGCASLRFSAARVADVASRWPAHRGSKLGALFEVASKREDLLAELCAAKPSTNAWAEVQKKFRYYTWTASAARLFQVVALFARPELIAECRAR